MRWKTPLQITTILLLITLTACNFPTANDPDNGTGSSDLVLTAAAETVQAQINANPPAATNTTAAFPTIPINTQPPNNQPQATNTSPAPAQNTPCNQAGFVSDITIPDGTVLAPGETFTKTWRLVNRGTCSWTTDYEIVFSSGEQMNGPDSAQLTSAAIAPDGTVDVSVQLTAPSSGGTYRGYWQLRSGDGIVFALTNDQAFWVEIKVTGATAGATATDETGGSTTLTLTTVDSGSVRSSGEVNANPNAGDTSGDLGSQAFVQFDISSIPDNAIIEAVVINFTNYDTLGDPFLVLGPLRAYAGDFFPLDAGDYVTSPTGAVLRWDDEAALSTTWEDPDVADAIQNALGDGWFELRIQFNEVENDGSGTADMIRFGTVSLKITYSTP